MQPRPIIIARNAPGPHLSILLQSLVLASLGGWGVATQEGPVLVLLWTLLVVFGVVAVVFLVRLLDGRPRIVIDADGVFDRHLGVGTIPWSEIHEAKLFAVEGQPFIGLGVIHAHRWVARMPWHKRWSAALGARWGYRPMNLYLANATVDPNTVYRVVQRWLDRKRERRSTDGLRGEATR